MLAQFSIEAASPKSGPVVRFTAWILIWASNQSTLWPFAAGLTSRAFRAWARLMHRKSETVYEDVMIAATAKVHGLTVATRNVADFKSFGVPLVNPFKT